MSSNSKRYANAVKLQYLNYEERKRKGGQRATDYLKHKPSYFTILPEFNDDMAMLILDNENNELIYAMRGLDFNAIKQDAPYAIAGAISGADVGRTVGNVMGGGRAGNRFASTGKLVGAGIGSYLTGNKEIRTALDILLSGAFNQQLQLDEETQQIKQGFEKRFMNEYIDDLNREIIKIRDIQNTFPNTKLVLAGHSRGAKKAEDLSKMLNLQAQMFNPAETTVYGNLLLQVLVPMFFSKSNTRDFTGESISGMMGDIVTEFQEAVRTNFAGSGARPELGLGSEAFSPEGGPQGQIFEGVVFEPGIAVDNPATPPRQTRPLTSPQPGGTPRAGDYVMNLPFEEGVSPMQTIRDAAFQQDMREKFGSVGRDLFNSLPTLNAYLQGRTVNFDSPANIGTEGALVQTALGMNNAPVSMKTIAEAAARYASLRYGGGLVKYGIDTAAGEGREASMATQLLANPFTLASLASLSASVVNPNERVEVTDPNLNIYRTPDDLVSKGYSDKYNVEPKPYVPSDAVERFIIGRHNIDNFVSEEMFYSTSQDRQINDVQETLNDRISKRKIPERMSDVFNKDIRDRKSGMSELMNKDVRQQPKLTPSPAPKKGNSQFVTSPTPAPTPPKSQFNIIMPTQPAPAPQSAEPKVYQTFTGQQFTGGTPGFEKINPYYLCKQNPNVVGCEDFY